MWYDFFCTNSSHERFSFVSIYIYVNAVCRMTEIAEVYDSIPNNFINWKTKQKNNKKLCKKELTKSRS